MISIQLVGCDLAAIIDDVDSRLSKHHWYKLKGKRTNYAVRKQGNRTILLHREVLRVPDNIHVDHINGQGLDCRHRNLRPATPMQNSWNACVRKHSKTGVKGVSIKGNRWRAVITVRGRRIRLGYFKTIQEAADAYDSAAIKYFRAFARLNNYHPA